jgi:hypothetical protein
MFVFPKSLPLKRSGSSNACASAYEKQSPKSRPARCLPFPYSRNARRAKSAWSVSTGTGVICAFARNRSRSRTASAPDRALEIEPMSVYALTNLGTFRLVQGKGEDAMEAFQKVDREGHPVNRNRNGRAHTAACKRVAAGAGRVEGEERAGKMPT